MSFTVLPAVDISNGRCVRLLQGRFGTEAVYSDDPVKVALAGAADIAVIKCTPLGGVRRALRVAEACGLPCVVSSALETSVGLAAGLALAAALPELPYACGLATVQLLADDVAVRPLLPVDGALPVGAVTVDPAALDRLRAAPAREAHWRSRLADVEDRAS